MNAFGNDGSQNTPIHSILLRKTDMTSPTLSPSQAAFGALTTSEPLTPAQIEARALALRAQLSLEEKIHLMSGDTAFWTGLLQLFGGGYFGQAWSTGGVRRLGVPGIRFVDGPRGVVLPGATTFPVPMARGATWDPALEQRVGEAMGREARACGANLLGAVCINLLRHPAWGRAQETYGEDPVHLGEMGAALTHGIQQHVMACAKHFALNSMENARFKVDVQIDARSLHEVYLPHFKRVVQAGVASVMSAYNSVNGQWAGQSRALLHDILVAQWGFDGVVQTDWVCGMRDAKAAALAGQHLEMPARNLFDSCLPGLVQRGEVPESAIDDAALRLLRQQLRFGQGREPDAYPAEIIGCEAHRRLAREVAQKSIVLLKNDGPLLPLAGVRHVAMLGRLADTANTGDQGSSDTHPAYVVRPLRGLRAAVGAGLAVAHDDGSDIARAAAVAAEAEVAVCVVGYDYRDEGEYLPSEAGPHTDHFPPPTAAEAPAAQAFAERRAALLERGIAGMGGDRERLALSEADERLITAVAAANPRTVVVIMAGSAVVTEAWRDSVPALLMLWYPGMEGGHALADVLLGRVNPGGKLPCSFPRSEDDLPFFDRQATQISYDLWHGYRKLERDGVAPAFAFGFGLSYTRFALGELVLDTLRIAPGGHLHLSVAVTNTGDLAGEEVVQLYVGARASAVPRAPQELKAFAKLMLQPGETRRVLLSVAAADLAYFDADRGWVVEPGRYLARVARSACDAQALCAQFEVA